MITSLNKFKGKLITKTKEVLGGFSKGFTLFTFNTARFQALKGGTWVQMAPKPKAKTAILNIKK